MAAIGILLIAGLPLIVIALASDSSLVFRAVIGLLLGIAAFIAMATVIVAFRESIRRRFLKFSLQDVCWPTLAIALYFASITNPDALMQSVLGVGFLGVISFWWARPEQWDSPKDYLTQVIGNGFAIALIVCTLWGLLGAFIFAAVRGIGR